MKRLQDKVTQSRLSLPLSSIYAILVWIGAGLIQNNTWVSFLLMALSVYFMVELNNRNTLIRVRSRMVSCSFLFLSLTMVTMLTDWRVALVQCCMTVFLSLIFNTYQNNNATGLTFYAFLTMGIASVAYVHTLYLVPLLLLLLVRPLYSFSLKTFSAALLGIILPYWFFSIYLIYIGGVENFIAHFTALADFSDVLKYDKVTIGALACYATITTAMLTGMIHFIHTSYKDKIYVRMLYRIFIYLSLILIALIAIVPIHAHILLALLSVTVSPLIGHFIALTHTRFTNYGFVTLLTIVIGITIFGLCLTSLYNTDLGECLSLHS